MKTLQVEVFRLWDDQTWDTAFVDIPADTDMDSPELQKACERVAVRQLQEAGQRMPCVVGVYWIPNDDDSDDEAVREGTGCGEHDFEA